MSFCFSFALKCKVGKVNFDVSTSVIIFFSGEIGLTQHGHSESQDSLIPLLCLKEWPPDLCPIGQDWTPQDIKAETLWAKQAGFSPFPHSYQDKQELV